MDSAHSTRSTYRAIRYQKPNKPREERTIEELLEHIGFGWPQVKISLLGGIVWIALGMEMMVITILGPILEYEWNITHVQQALLTAMMFVGTCVGSPICGYMADNFGRLKLLTLSSVWTLIYAILCAMAPNYVWLVILRILLGIGLTGANQFTSYYSEFMPSKYRGKMTVFVMVYWASGSTLSVLTAVAFTRFGWRWWLLLSGVPSLVFILVSQFLPESQRYELACGRPEEARRILKMLAEGNGHTLPDVTIKQIELKDKGRLVDLFTPNLRRTSILLGIIWFIGGVTYFGITLFTTYLTRAGSTCTSDLEITKRVAQCRLESTKLTTANLWDLLWTMTSDLPAILVSFAIIDTLGRKASMLLQAAMFLLACLALLFCMTKIPMITVLFVGRCSAAGYIQILYLYTNEVFPTNVRGMGLGYGQTLINVGGLITPAIAQVMFQHAADSGLLVYAVFGIICIVAIFLLPTETKKQEMADNFVY